MCGFVTVERLRKQSSAGCFPHAARAGEQIGVVEPLMLDSAMRASVPLLLIVVVPLRETRFVRVL